MFASNRFIRLYSLEFYFMITVIGMFGINVFVICISLIPHNYIIVILSLFIFISLLILAIAHITKFKLLFGPLYLLSFYILVYLCVLHDANYIPIYLKWFSVLFCIISSLSSAFLFIRFKNKTTYYVNQFEMADQIRFYLASFYIMGTISVVEDILAFGAFHAFFILPYAIFFLSCICLYNDKLNDKLFYTINGFALIASCVHNYIIFGNLFKDASYLTLIFIMFYLRKQFEKRHTIFVYAVILCIYTLGIYFKILASFTQNLERTLNIIGLVINMILFAAEFIKTKQITVKKIFASLIGTYTAEDIAVSIKEYYQHNVNDEYFINSSLIKSIDYAEKKISIPLDTSLKNDVIQKLSDEDKEIYTTVVVKRRPKIVKAGSDLLEFLKLHWRMFLSGLLVIIYLCFFVSGINAYISRTMKENGVFFPVFDGVHYAQNYSREILRRLSEKESFDDMMTFSSFAAGEFTKQAAEYREAGNSEMEIKLLSASLFFHKDFDVLYRRYSIYSSLNYYEEAISDIDALIPMTENEYFIEMLIDDRCVINMYYGYCEEALKDAKRLYELNPVNENKAYMGACLIGTGNYHEAIDILNSAISENQSIPVWAYRMRGLAYLSLAEIGEQQYLPNASSDILYACGREATVNNTLALARLYLFSDENEKAFEAIQSAIDLNQKNGRAYYWLSVYYGRMNDAINQTNALNTARALNYKGNGEY